MADAAGLDKIAIDNLTPEERAHSAVYLDTIACPAGQATIGGQPIDIEHPYLVAFVDRKPGANWMHPCRYLVIDPADRTFVAIESNRPPVFGPLPGGWRLIWRSPDIQDWQVLKIAET